MTRNPAADPKPGDRWRDEWGTCFVASVDPNSGSVSILHGETMTARAFAAFARNARFIRNERTGEVWA